MIKNNQNNDFFTKNERFSHLLAFYGRLLKYQNAVGDLWAFLWELLNRYGTELSDEYIRTCVYHEYLRLSKNETKNRFIELLECDVSTPQIDVDLRLDISTAFDTLTENEQEVLRLNLALGYNCEEIAKIKKCTRQGVHNTKHRAFKKMRALL